MRRQGDDAPAEERLRQAIAALTKAIKAADSCEPRYFRSQAYEMLGDDVLSREDYLAATKMDETYQMAYIYEPMEEPIDLRPSRRDENGAKEEPDHASMVEDSTSGTIQDSDSDGDVATSEILGTDDEPKDTPNRSDPISRRSSAQDTGNARRAAAGGTLVGPGQPADYRGSPASLGEWSVTGQPTQFGASSRGKDDPADGPSSADAEETPGEDSSGGILDENESGEEESTALDESPGEDANPSSEPSPRRARPIWPLPAGPWVASPSTRGFPYSVPTTGIGGASGWGSTRSAGLPNPGLPTTGLGGTPLTRSWPLAPSNPLAPTAPSSRPMTPQVPSGPGSMVAPAPLQPNPWPQQPVGTPPVPHFGPQVAPPSLPSTGVHRTVSPYPE